MKFNDFPEVYQRKCQGLFSDKMTKACISLSNSCFFLFEAVCKERKFIILQGLSF